MARRCFSCHAVQPDIPGHGQPKFCSSCGAELPATSPPSTTDKVGILVELDGANIGRRIELPPMLTIGCQEIAPGTWEGGALVQRKGPGRYLIKELDASSRVFLDDERVAQAPLRNASFLRIGQRSYRFFLEDVQKPQDAAHAPRAPRPRGPAERRPAPAVTCARCNAPLPRTDAVRRRGLPYCRPCAASLRRGPSSSVLVSVVAVVLAGAALTAWLATRTDSKAERRSPPPRASQATRTPKKAAKTPALLSMADLVASVEGGVAKVSGGGSMGTGFLIEDGVLATNAHVIEEMFLSEIRVQYPKRGSRQERVTAILHKDNARDLCLLSVSRGPPPLRLAQSNSFRRGEEVLLIGNPGVGDYAVLENAVTQGLLSALTTIEGLPFFQISASVNPGNSGGPVLNRKGEVVCIATLRAGGVEGIAFGIPSADVRTALRKALRVKATETRAAEAHHNAEVVFLRMAQFGRAYLVGMYVNVVAMERAIAVDLDPSVALWAANAAYAPHLAEAKRRWEEGLSPHYQRTIGERSLEDRTQRLFRELRACTDDLRDYVDDPRGRIDRYLASYKRFRVTYASLVSRLGHELEVSKDLVSDLPEER